MTVCFNREIDKFGELSNYFVLPKAMLFDGKSYASSEHLYQALKFLGPGATAESKRYSEAIRTAKTPNTAKILAHMRIRRGYQSRIALNSTIQEALDRGVAPRPDWGDVKLDTMRMVLTLKFQQSTICRTVLLFTNRAAIADHTSADLYWGDGGDAGSAGQNHLGRLLVEIRDLLRRTTKRKLCTLDGDAKRTPAAVVDDESDIESLV